MEDRISIIIPCYNVEKYIMRCLKSVERQTCGMERLEIVLIDDASTDNTGSLLEAFRDRNRDNVLLIKHRRNRGIGVSRNEGMDCSGGKYIMFVDGDDILAGDICEKLRERAEQNQCDLVECGYRFFQDERDAVSGRIGEDWLRDLGKDEDLKWYLVRIPKMAVWGRLYRRAFLEQNQLRFSEKIYMGEDIDFTVISAFCMKKYYFVAEQLYFYFCNLEGMLHSKRYTPSINRIMEDVAEDILAELKKRDLYDRAYITCHDEFGWVLMGFLYFGNIQKLYGEAEIYKNALLSVFPDILSNSWLQNVDERHAKYLSFLRQGRN